MTPEEAKAVLRKRPRYMRTRVWVMSELRYEEHRGIHTYHPCDCGRAFTRCGWCPHCLRELLEVCDARD